MDVRIRVPTQLRQLSGGEAVLVVAVTGDRDDRAVTVADVCDVLAVTHPMLERRVRDERRHVRAHVNLFVGDDNVRDLQGTATVLAAGVELSILPAVSGG